MENLNPKKSLKTLNKENTAYIIKDNNLPDFEVRKSANAWWMDKGKVERLIEAYKKQSTDGEACFYAGITIAQLKYFRKTHADFSTIKDACGEALFLEARETIAREIPRNPEFALKFMERKKREEFGLRREVINNKPLIGSESYEERLRRAREKNKNTP